MPVSRRRWTEPNIQEALAWCKSRQRQNISCTIAFLGGIPENDGQAKLALDTNLDAVNLIAEQGFNASITMKLTVLGALLDKVRCRNRALKITEEAAKRHLTVEVATESKDLVSFALETAVSCARENGNVILDLQAYLNRTREDLNVAAENGVRVRLVKGAYVGDLNNREEVQDRFKGLVESAVEKSQEILLGTHDLDLIDWVKAKFQSKKQRIEFGFLKGLSDKTKVELAKQGWRVLEYVPFGDKTEAYENRRMKFLRDLEAMGKAPAP